jgi:hypothetical protein
VSQEGRHRPGPGYGRGVETVYGTSTSGTDSATMNTFTTNQDTGFPRLSVVPEAHSLFVRSIVRLKAEATSVHREVTRDHQEAMRDHQEAMR